MSVATPRFSYIKEWDDEFLTLFFHRFDYIYAKHPQPGETLDWQTESRYPLSDRILRQGSYLFGVRFGSQTQYCLLDIDSSSPYHPQRDPFAISRIVAALESLGLVACVVCTSSYSGGLHLYFPFQEPVSSWELAIAVSTLIENAGFKLNPGQLEVFPNPKPYIVDGTPSLFNAHRLPIQAGSYLLNEDFQPIWSDQHSFVQQWQFTQKRNDVTSKTLKRVLKQVKRRHYRVSGKADQFINDLNAEIEVGWTGPGQTNRLLGRITLREYIFHHILQGGEPLEGQALVNEIVAVARALPGYEEWCQHQHEIEKRAEEWARCVENSHYFHYGDQKGKYKAIANESANDSLPSWNQRQSEAARERIRRAIADLLDKESLPTGATARFQTLTSYRIGGASLYRHRDLWHPEYLTNSVENPPDPPASAQDSPLDCVEDTSNGHNPSSLLSEVGSNSLSSLDPNNFSTLNLSSEGSNVPLDEPLNYPNEISDQSNGIKPVSQEGIQFVQQALLDVKTWIEVNQEASRIAHERASQIRNEAYQFAHVARMQRYLESGDPILMAEALAWAQINPDVLQEQPPPDEPD
jgi:hypothetical protein